MNRQLALEVKLAQVSLFLLQDYKDVRIRYKFLLSQSLLEISRSFETIDDFGHPFSVIAKNDRTDNHLRKVFEFLLRLKVYPLHSAPY